VLIGHFDISLVSGTGSRIKKSTPPEADKAENKFLRINPLFFCLDTKESKNQGFK